MSKNSLYNLLDSSVRDGYSGFQELSSILEECIKGAENAVDVLEVGAKEFTKDLLKLAKPISKIRKSGYTHLIDTFSYEKEKKEVIVGWGKYYGRMVEYGTKKMSARVHLRICFEQNKEKYYKMMIAKLGL